MSENKTCLLVVGGTSSGKTVAASNVFTHMTMEGGVKAALPDGRTARFCLVADPRSGRPGKDIEEFVELYQDMLEGRSLPIGSTENRTYELLFQENGTNVGSVMYLDYRGGLTRLYDGTETAKRENEEFDFMLGNSGILIYIISGSVLQKFLDQEENTAKMTREKRAISKEVAMIETLIERARQQKNATAPILYYVTKADRVTAGRDQILPGLKRFLDTYGLIPEGRKVLGCYSTLGWNVIIKKENGEFAVNDEDDQEGGRRKIDGGLDPVGFEIPMMLTMGHCLSESGKRWAEEECARLRQAIDEMKRQKDQTSAESWKAEHGLRRIKNGIFGFFLGIDERKALESDLEDLRERLAELEEELRNGSIDARNTDKRYSLDILAYLNEKFPNAILYIDENGKKQPLENFFN